MTFALHPSPFAHRALDEHAHSLRQHMQDCRALRGRWFDAALLAERAHRVVAPRFVTTLVVATSLLALLLGGF